ncbi:MAG TPA: hypothetical protein VEW42_06200 [Candidatus Eisenbacteria bacterium]|nr:hypothetical protein [Candidatus Eisenbacteria bacterium]
MNKIVFFLYVLFLLCFTFFSYLFIDPGLIYLRPLFTNFHQTHRMEVTSIFTLFIFLSFIFYFLCLHFIKKNQLTMKHICMLIGITAGILVFAYPAIVSFDIFNYIATAKVAYFYHENPYIIMPIEFTNDPLLLFMHAANKIALYAPVWIFLTRIPHILGFGNFLLTLLQFKVLVGLFYGTTVWLLWRMTKNSFKIAFFALNPLVIFEIFVGGHNDIVMMFLFLVSAYFLFSKRIGKSVVSFIFSGLIKYATLILTPLYVVSFFKTMSQKTFFFWATVGMYCIFFLSSLREEIYPWYGIWFLLPASFLVGDNLITYVSLAFSFSLLLRYIPFMLLGTYFGPTPLLKILLTFVPVIVVLIAYCLKKQRILR